MPAIYREKPRERMNPTMDKVNNTGGQMHVVLVGVKLGATNLRKKMRTSLWPILSGYVKNCEPIHLLCYVFILAAVDQSI